MVAAVALAGVAAFWLFRRRRAQAALQRIRAQRSGEELSGLRAPHPSRAVVSHRRDEPSVRAERHRVDLARVALEFGHAVPRGGLPDPQDALAAGLITRNEAREVLNYEALEGEDVLYEPAMASVVPSIGTSMRAPRPPRNAAAIA